MQFVLTDKDIEPFSAEIIGTLKSRYSSRYPLDQFTDFLAAFNRKKDPSKKYLLYIGGEKPPFIPKSTS